MIMYCVKPTIVVNDDYSCNWWAGADCSVSGTDTDCETLISFDSAIISNRDDDTTTATCVQRTGKAASCKIFSI